MPRASQDRLRQVVEPVVRARRCTLYDVEFPQRGPTQVLKVFIDRSGGVDTDTCAEVSRSLSQVLDDADVIQGRYTLEVSSPGLERSLRRPEHFAAIAGTDTRARVKVRAGDGAEVCEGKVTAAGEETFTLDGRDIAYDDVLSARTVFVWPAAAKKGGKK